MATSPRRSRCLRCGLLQLVATDMRVLPGATGPRRWICADLLACEARRQLEIVAPEVAR